MGLAPLLMLLLAVLGICGGQVVSDVDATESTMVMFEEETLPTPGFVVAANPNAEEPQDDGPSEAAALRLSLPPVSLFYPACTIYFIDPNSAPSSEAFDVKGILDDCASACSSETMFKCTAYSFAGPGSYCVLHGALDKAKVSQLAGSPYSITDVACSAPGSSGFQLCTFNPISGVSIDPADLGTGANIVSKRMSAMNTDHCETFCRMQTYGAPCTGFAFDPTVSSIGNTNCVLISRDNATTLTPAEGNYQYFESPCAVADYTKYLQKQAANVMDMAKPYLISK